MQHSYPCNVTHVKYIVLSVLPIHSDNAYSTKIFPYDSVSWKMFENRQYKAACDIPVHLHWYSPKLEVSNKHFPLTRFSRDTSDISSMFDQFPDISIFSRKVVILCFAHKY